jgi:hypothetical protein
VQPVGKTELAPCHFTILVCVGEFSMRIPEQVGQAFRCHVGH